MQTKIQRWVTAIVAIGAMGLAMVAQADQPKSAYEILLAAYKAAQSAPPKECKTGTVFATKACVSALQYKTIENIAQGMLNVAPLIDQFYVLNDSVDVVGPFTLPKEYTYQNVPVFEIAELPKTCADNGDVVTGTIMQYHFSAATKQLTRVAQNKFGAVLGIYVWGSPAESITGYQPGDKYIQVSVCLKSGSLGMPAGTILPK